MQSSYTKYVYRLSEWKSYSSYIMIDQELESLIILGCHRRRRLLITDSNIYNNSCDTVMRRRESDIYNYTRERSLQYYSRPCLHDFDIECYRYYTARSRYPYRVNVLQYHFNITRVLSETHMRMPNTALFASDDTIMTISINQPQTFKKTLIDGQRNPYSLHEIEVQLLLIYSP